MGGKICQLYDVLAEEFDEYSYKNCRISCPVAMIRKLSAKKFCP